MRVIPIFPSNIFLLGKPGHALIAVFLACSSFCINYFLLPLLFRFELNFTLEQFAWVCRLCSLSLSSFKQSPSLHFLVIVITLIIVPTVSTGSLAHALSTAGCKKLCTWEETSTRMWVLHSCTCASAMMMMAEEDLEGCGMKSGVLQLLAPVSDLLHL